MSKSDLKPFSVDGYEGRLAGLLQLVARVLDLLLNGFRGAKHHGLTELLDGQFVPINHNNHNQE